MSQPNLSGDKIMEMLNGMKDKVTDPKTLSGIEKGFGEAFAKIKDKLGDSWEDAQAIYHMAFDKDFDMKSETKIAAIGALAYLVSPIDLIPERFLGPLGLADDVAVLMFALNYSRPEIERYRAFKANQNAQQANTPSSIPPGS